MKSRKIAWAASFIVVIVLVAIALLVWPPVGPTSGGAGIGTRDASARPVLRLAYRPRALTDVSPVILAENPSMGRPEVDVRLVPVATAQEAFARFAAGEIDALAGMPLEATFAQMSDPSGVLKFRAYAVSVDKPNAGWVAIVASKDSGVTQLSQLEGKPIASLPTDQANWLLRRILKKAGLTVDPSKVVRYAPTNPIAGLRAGEVAAIFGPEPGNAMAVAEGGVVLVRGPISSMLYEGRPVPITASLISNDFIKQNPAAYNAFLAMIDAAIAQAESQPELVRSYFGRETYGGLSPAVVRSLELPVMLRPNAEVAAVAKVFVADLKTDGLLKAPVDSDRLLLHDR